MMNDHGRKFDYRWEFAGKQQESRPGIRRQMALAQSTVQVGSPRS
jgi:hypothetical protein